MTVSSLFLSPGGTDTATLTVTRQIPRAQSCPDSDPSLQVWVGGGLSRLYDTGLRGTPLMLSVCLNVNLSFPLEWYIGVIADITLWDLNVLDHLGLRVIGDLASRLCVSLVPALIYDLIGRSSGAATGTGTRAAIIAPARAAIVLLIPGRRAAAVTKIDINSDTHYAAAPFPLILTLVFLHDVSICYAIMIFVEGVISTDHQTSSCLDLYHACWFIYNPQVKLIISSQIYLLSETSQI